MALNNPCNNGDKLGPSSRVVSVVQAVVGSDHCIEVGDQRDDIQLGQ